MRFPTTMVAVWATLALAGVTAALAAPMHKHGHAKQAPGKPDTATTKLSDNKRYRVSIAPQNGPARINVMHAWIVTVATADGRPVEAATIAVDGGMPDHGHGLPTAPRVTRHLGGGKYLLEGLKFSMTGWWQLKLTFTSPAPDTVTFNLHLK